MQVSPVKRGEPNCTGRYSRGLKNQNGESLVNLCEWNILETQFIYGLARILFLSESTSATKTNSSQKGILLLSACWVSQSVFCQVLNAVRDGLLKIKCLMEK